MTAAIFSEDPIQSLLARLRKAGDGQRVSVRDMVQAAGHKSFSMPLLLASLLVITPLSAIPTVPTIAAITIGLIVGQWAVGRSHLWLPGWILRKSVDADRFSRSIERADRPARFIDRHTSVRLDFLARPPFSLFGLLAILAVVMTWPLLELLPMFTTVTAFGIAALALGLMARDGVWMLVGYAYLATLGGLAIWLI